MTGPGSWLVVREANSTDLLLAADFPITGRREAGIAELAGHLNPAYSLWQIAPPAVPPDSEITAEEYLGPWLADVADSALSVRAVLGYCAGAGYAAELAARIARQQDTAPQIVLFDPELVDATTIYVQFGRVVANMAMLLNTDETAELRARANQLFEKADGNVRGLASALFHMLEVVAARVFERAGLDAEYSTQLIGLIGSFMSYLGVAEQLGGVDSWSRATAISSASPTSGLNRLRAAGRDANLVAREIRFDVEHGDLLRSDGVAAAINALLATR
jgi:hypothetical protein